MNLWPAIEASHRGERLRRLPFHVLGHAVGSVDRLALPALREATAGEPGWRLDEGGEGGVRLDRPDVEPAMAHVNQRLREAGQIPGWRDERVPLYAVDGDLSLGSIERAAARWWGSLTLGAHATGWVAGADGRPVSIWIARRAPDKPTDPGKFDNLVGGGVPEGQDPWTTLVREGWEEAGFEASTMVRARPGRTLWIDRAVPEGWQRERIHAYELELPSGREPHNQDGEVAGFECLPVAQAVPRAAGEAMTVDAALVTLEFLLRHGLLPAERAAALERRCAAVGLWA